MSNAIQSQSYFSSVPHYEGFNPLNKANQLIIKADEIFKNLTFHLDLASSEPLTGKRFWHLVHHQLAKGSCYIAAGSFSTSEEYGIESFGLEWIDFVTAVEKEQKISDQLFKQTKCILYIQDLKRHFSVVNFTRNRHGKEFLTCLFDVHKGNHEHFYELGNRFYAGIGTAIDIPKALFWFQKAAALNNINACFLLYKFFKEGKHVEKDAHVALIYLRKAACHNHPIALFELGQYIESLDDNGSSLNQAFSCYKKGADLGNIDCMHACGKMLYKGHVVDISKTAALGYFEKASLGGHIDAMFMTYLLQKELYAVKAATENLNKAIQNKHVGALLEAANDKSEHYKKVKELYLIILEQDLSNYGSIESLCYYRLGEIAQEHEGNLKQALAYYEQSLAKGYSRAHKRVIAIDAKLKMREQSRKLIEQADSCSSRSLFQD